MIGDTFVVNEKTYTLKRDVSFGEYKKISKISNNLQNLTRDYINASEEAKSDILLKFTEATDSQLDIIGEFLESMLALKQKDIDSLTLMGAIELFNETFTVSTQVKKKLEITSDSP